MSNLLPVFIVIIISSSSINVHQPVVMVTCNQEQPRGCTVCHTTFKALQGKCVNISVQCQSTIVGCAICTVSYSYQICGSARVYYGAFMDINFNVNGCLPGTANCQYAVV